MQEGLRQFSIEDAAQGLKIVDGDFLRGQLCNEFGEKSAVGKLLMLIGVSDMHMVETDPKSADRILRSAVYGLTHIQIALLHYLNDELPKRDPKFLTGFMVDILTRPQRFLGKHAPLILTLDKIVHDYNSQQLAQIPQLDWDSWSSKVKVSAAIHSSSLASKSEAGDFGDAWYIANRAARISAACFDPNIQNLFAFAVNEVQGYQMYDLYKPTKEHPNQPVHRPEFILMFFGPDGSKLDIETLKNIKLPG